MNDIEVYSGISAMEAEQAVLGAMLVDARSVPEVMEGVKVDDFRPGPNQDIYRAIHAMFLAGEPIDPVTVLENMRRSGYYDENQSRAYMLQLMDATPTAANVGEYIKILRDRSLQRQVASIINDLGGMIKEGLTSGRDLLEELEKRASNIRLGRSQSGLVPVSEVLLEAYDCLEETAVNGKSSSTVSTGLPDLDRRINGLRGGNLIVLAARPGMGKTSMALNMALEAGKFSGKEVAFFSLEVGRLEEAIQGSGMGAEKKAIVIAQLEAAGIRVTAWLSNQIDAIVAALNASGAWLATQAKQAANGLGADDSGAKKPAEKTGGGNV